MSRSLEILITETAEELKNQWHSQREGRTKERIQALYWLKTGQAETALEVASLIGKSYSTVKRGLRIDRRDGLKQMKKVTHGGGRTLSVPPEILEQLNGRLKQREGFSGYEEIQAWLKEIYGLELGYKTLYGIGHARLKARPKVVRPQSAARDESKASEFEKKGLRLGIMATLYHTEGNPVPYWCADESRFGLKTITRRRITKQGVKPIGPVQWSFQAYYLCGLVEPLTGESFLLEFSHLNTDCFQAFLHEFAKAYPDDIHLLQVDNARFHTAKRLVIPDQVILWFQPPHSPECNPIERLWARLKDKLSWQLFDSLDALKDRLAEILKLIPRDFLASLTGQHSLRAA